MWRFELFGEPKAVGYGQTIRRFGSKRAIALLAYLALHPRTRHPREVLADRLWPESPPDVGRNNLKQTLATLRRLLEPPELATGQVFDADRSSIGLVDGSYVLDVDEYRAAVAIGDSALAAQLKTGDLLPGFYDEWIDDIRLELDSEAEARLLSPVSVAQGRNELIRKSSRSVLPGQVHPVVGREEVIESLISLLEFHRWITLTGLGGIGKTTIALAAARVWGGGECFFIPLTEVVDPRQVAYEILRRIGVSEVGTGDPMEALRIGLLGREVLLVLDNMEQLSGADGAKAIEGILDAIESVRIIVSSRVPIEGQGELEFPVYPLPVPGESDSLRDVGANPSARLFVHRARLVRADFQITERNLEPFRRLCILLEGVPLAIELCAAWSHTLSPNQMLAKVLHENDLLVSRRRDAPARHRSLQGAFAASCELLEPQARQFLSKLSVFRGGCDLQLASSVTREPQALELLSKLLDAALIVAEHGTEPPRYQMLESLRTVAQERLTDADARDLEDSFCDHLFLLAKASSKFEPFSSRKITGQAGWNRLLKSEWPNFRAAVLLLLDGDPSRALEMTLNLEWHWSARSMPAEPKQWLERGINALSKDSPLARRARVSLLAAGQNSLSAEEAEASFLEIIESAESANDALSLGEALLRFSQFKDIRRKREGMLETALEAARVFESAGCQRGKALAHYVSANYFVNKADEASGMVHLGEAKRIFGELGDLIHLASCHYVDARFSYTFEKYADAAFRSTESLNLAAQVGDGRLVARAANLMSICFKELGEHARGRVHLMLSILGFHASGDWAGAHYPLWNLALALNTAGRHSHAVKMMSASMCIWEQYFGTELFPDEQQELDRVVADAKAELTELAFLEAEAFGRRSTPKEVVAASQQAVASDMAETPDAFMLIESLQ